MKYYRSHGNRPCMGPVLWLAFGLALAFGVQDVDLHLSPLVTTVSAYAVISVFVIMTKVKMINYWTAIPHRKTKTKKAYDLVKLTIQALILSLEFLTMFTSFANCATIFSTLPYIWHYWAKYGLQLQNYHIMVLRKGKRIRHYINWTQSVYVFANTEIALQHIHDKNHSGYPFTSDTSGIRPYEQLMLQLSVGEVYFLHCTLFPLIDLYHLAPLFRESLTIRAYQLYTGQILDELFGLYKEKPKFPPTDTYSTIWSHYLQNFVKLWSDRAVGVNPFIFLHTITETIKTTLHHITRLPAYRIICFKLLQLCYLYKVAKKLMVLFVVFRFDYIYYYLFPTTIYHNFLKHFKEVADSYKECKNAKYSKQTFITLFTVLHQRPLSKSWKHFLIKFRSDLGKEKDFEVRLRNIVIDSFERCYQSYIEKVPEQFTVAKQENDRVYFLHLLETPTTSFKLSIGIVKTLLWFLLFTFITPLHAKKFSYTTVQHAPPQDQNLGPVNAFMKLLIDAVWYLVGVLLNGFFYLTLLFFGIIIAYLVFVYSLRKLHSIQPYKPRSGIFLFIYIFSRFWWGYGPNIKPPADMTIVDVEGKRIIVVKQDKRMVEFCYECNCTGHSFVNCPMNNLLNCTLITNTKFMDINYALEHKIHVDSKVKSLYVSLKLKESGQAPLIDTLKMDKDIHQSISSILRGTKEYAEQPINHDAYQKLLKIRNNLQNNVLGTVPVTPMEELPSSNVSQATSMTSLDSAGALSRDTNTDSDVSQLFTSASGAISLPDDGSTSSKTSEPIYRFHPNSRDFEKPGPKLVFGKPLYAMFVHTHYAYVVQGIPTGIVLTEVKSMAQLKSEVIRGKTDFKCNFFSMHFDFTELIPHLNAHLLLIFDNLMPHIYYTPRSGLRIVKIKVAQPNTDPAEINNMSHIRKYDYWTLGKDWHGHVDRMINELGLLEVKLHIVLAKNIYPKDHQLLVDSLCTYALKHHHVITSDSQHMQNRIKQAFDENKSILSILRDDPAEADLCRNVVKEHEYKLNLTEQIKLSQQEFVAVQTQNQIPRTSTTPTQFTTHNSIPVPQQLPAGMPSPFLPPCDIQPHLQPPVPKAAKPTIFQRLQGPRLSVLPRVDVNPRTGEEVYQARDEVESVSSDIGAVGYEGPCALVNEQPEKLQGQLNLSNPSVRQTLHLATDSGESSSTTSLTTCNTPPTDSFVDVELGEPEIVQNEPESLIMDDPVPDLPMPTFSVSTDFDFRRTGVVVGDEYTFPSLTSTTSSFEVLEPFTIKPSLDKISEEVTITEKANVPAQSEHVIDIVSRENSPFVPIDPPTADLHTDNTPTPTPHTPTPITPLATDGLLPTPQSGLLPLPVLPGRRVMEDINVGRYKKLLRISVWNLAAFRFVTGIEHINVLEAFYNDLAPADQKKLLNIFRSMQMSLTNLKNILFKETFTHHDCYAINSAAAFGLFNNSAFNFTSLYQDGESHGIKYIKLGALFNYFSQETKPGEIRITTRISTEIDRSSTTVAKIYIHDQPLEHFQHHAYMNFANKNHGGGVLRRGAVQEELLFFQFPELFVSRYVIPRIQDSQVVCTSGLLRFNTVEGYSHNARFFPARATTPHTIISADAINCKSTNQYTEQNFDRELLKAYNAFMSTNFSRISTGNWGCGAFGGDYELKFVIQLLAASYAGVSLQYSTFGQQKYLSRYTELYNLILDKYSLSGLEFVVRKFCLRGGPIPLRHFLQQNIPLNIRTDTELGHEKLTATPVDPVVIQSSAFVTATTKVGVLGEADYSAGSVGFTTGVPVFETSPSESAQLSPTPSNASLIYDNLDNPTSDTHRLELARSIIHKHYYGGERTDEEEWEYRKLQDEKETKMRHYVIYLLENQLSKRIGLEEKTQFSTLNSLHLSCLSPSQAKRIKLTINNEFEAFVIGVATQRGYTYNVWDHKMIEAVRGSMSQKAMTYVSKYIQGSPQHFPLYIPEYEKERKLLEQQSEVQKRLQVMASISKRDRQLREEKEYHRQQTLKLIHEEQQQLYERDIAMRKQSEEEVGYLGPIYAQKQTKSNLSTSSSSSSISSGAAMEVVHKAPQIVSAPSQNIRSILKKNATQFTRLQLFFFITMLLLLCISGIECVPLKDYYSNNQSYACMGTNYHYISDKSQLEQLKEKTMDEVVVLEEEFKDYYCQLSKNNFACLGSGDEKYVLDEIEDRDEEFPVTSAVIAKFRNITGCSGSSETDTPIFICKFGKIPITLEFTIDETGNDWVCDLEPEVLSSKSNSIKHGFGNEIDAFRISRGYRDYHRALLQDIDDGKVLERKLPYLSIKKQHLCEDFGIKTPTGCDLIPLEYDIVQTLVWRNGARQVVECHRLDSVCHDIVSTIIHLSIHNNPLPSKHNTIRDCTLLDNQCIAADGGSICFHSHNNSFIKLNSTGNIIKPNTISELRCAELLENIELDISLNYEDLDADILLLFNHIKTIERLYKKVTPEHLDAHVIDKDVRKEHLKKQECISKSGRVICEEVHVSDRGNRVVREVHSYNDSRITCDEFVDTIAPLISITGGQASINKSCTDGAVWTVAEPMQLLWYLQEYAPYVIPHFRIGSHFSGNIRLSETCGLSDYFWNCYTVAPIKIRCGSLTGVYDIDTWFRPICTQNFGNIRVVIKTAAIKECTNGNCTTGEFNTVFDSDGNMDFDLLLRPGHPAITVTISGAVDESRDFFLPFSPQALGTTGYVESYPHSNLSINVISYCYGSNWHYQQYRFVKSNRYLSTISRVFEGVDGEEIECYESSLFYAIFSRAITLAGWNFLTWLTIIAFILFVLLIVRAVIDRFFRGIFGYVYTTYICDIIFYFCLLILMTFLTPYLDWLYWVTFGFLVLTPFFYLFFRLRSTASNRNSNDLSALVSTVIIFVVSFIFIFLSYASLFFYCLIGAVVLCLGYYIVQDLYKSPWDYDMYQINPEVINKWFPYSVKMYGDGFQLAFNKAKMEVNKMSVPDKDKLNRYYQLHFLNEIRTMNEGTVKTKVWKKEYLHHSTLGFAGLEDVSVKKPNQNITLEGVVTFASFKTKATPDIDNNLTFLYYGNSGLNGLYSGNFLYIQRHLFLEEGLTYNDIFDKIKNKHLNNELIISDSNGQNISIKSLDHINISRPIWVFELEHGEDDEKLYPEIKFAEPKTAACTFKSINKTDKCLYSEETSCLSSGLHFANTTAGDCGGVLVQRGVVVGFHIATYRGAITGLFAPLGTSTVNIYVNFEGRFLSQETTDIDLETQSTRKIENKGPIFASTIISWFLIIYLANKRSFPNICSHGPVRGVHFDYGLLDRPFEVIFKHHINHCKHHGVVLTMEEITYVRDFAYTCLEDDFASVIAYNPVGLKDFSLNCLSAYGYVFFDFGSAMALLVKEGTSQLNLESVLSLPSRHFESFWYIWFGEHWFLNFTLRCFLLAFLIFFNYLGDSLFLSGFRKYFVSDFIEGIGKYVQVYNGVAISIIIIGLPADSLGWQFFITFLEVIIRIIEHFVLEFNLVIGKTLWYWYYGEFGISWFYLVPMYIFLILFIASIIFLCIKGYYLSVDIHCYLLYAIVPLMRINPLLRQIGGYYYDICSIANPAVFICLICWFIWIIRSSLTMSSTSSKLHLESDTDPDAPLRTIYYNLCNNFASSLRQLPEVTVGKEFLFWFDQYGKDADLVTLQNKSHDLTNRLNLQFPKIEEEYLAHGYLSDVEIGSYLIDHYNLQVEGTNFLNLVTNLIKGSMIAKFRFSGIDKLTTQLQRAFLYWLNANRAHLNQLLKHLRSTNLSHLNPELLATIRHEILNIDTSYTAYSRLYKELAKNTDKNFWTNAWMGLVEYLLLHDYSIDLLDDYKAIVQLHDLNQRNFLLESSTEELLEMQNNIDELREELLLASSNKEKSNINSKIGVLQRKMKEVKHELNIKRAREIAEEAKEKRQHAIQQALLYRTQSIQKKNQALTTVYSLAMSRLANCLYYVGLLKKAGTNYEEVMAHLKQTYKGDYDKIWRHLNNQLPIKLESNSITDTIPVYNNDDRITGYVTKHNHPVLAAIAKDGEVRLDVDSIISSDRPLSLPGMYIPYGQASVEAYFTNDPLSTCNAPMVAPCGTELVCDRRGRHSKLNCCGTFRKLLENHIEGCNVCFSAFLIKRLHHGRCGQQLITTNINDYVREVMLCAQCNQCTSCNGLARNRDNAHCTSQAWHGTRCTTANCQGCTLDHVPVIILENYEMKTIPYNALNKITLQREGDAWSYYINHDGTIIKIAHVGAGPPQGFFKVSRDVIKHITDKDVYVDPIIFRQGQFSNFLMNIRSIALESIKCVNCNKPPISTCITAQHNINSTKTDDIYDIMFLNGKLDLSEYITHCGKNILQLIKSTTKQGTLYKAGSCGRTDRAHLKYCGLHSTTDILIPTIIPPALHSLYIRTYLLDKKCSICAGGMWTATCQFCEAGTFATVPSEPAVTVSDTLAALENSNDHNTIIPSPHNSCTTNNCTSQHHTLDPLTTLTNNDLKQFSPEVKQAIFGLLESIRSKNL